MPSNRGFGESSGSRRSGDGARPGSRRSGDGARPGSRGNDEYRRLAREQERRERDERALRRAEKREAQQQEGTSKNDLDGQNSQLNAQWNSFKDKSNEYIKRHDEQQRNIDEMMLYHLDQDIIDWNVDALTIDVQLRAFNGLLDLTPQEDTPEEKSRRIPGVDSISTLISSLLDKRQKLIDR